MACVGECKKQVHRFGGQTTTVEKSDAACPDLTNDELSAILKKELGGEHPDTKLQGCADNLCDCVRLEGDIPVWLSPPDGGPSPQAGRLRS